CARIYNSGFYGGIRSLDVW
nr:immunoglobulin heavy chain junction region [Macaca mulatta]MOV55816.1 immunoglobulin heavy chain junction region [Macaca mulatta]MOV59256.1 immunoglobulin heavy chain junction region [Macaca mulatta]MOV60380.1 immunoglobulin heavy chain junction region [Macaca mulatta]MOV60736.1 immunoglobulin heavy chain junction region [Macaca mulatta]